MTERDYGRAVHTALAAALDALTPDALERPVDMTRVGLGVWAARDLWCLHGFEHVHIHGGEIACLKRVQGGVGWTEPAAFRAVVVVEEA